MNYKLLNRIIGWCVFLIATIVYFLCCEPTTSFWDCGEYISTSYKLQVGHPSGAPLFQLLGRCFSLFANGNTAQVAVMINRMSALASGFTILFLFWTITYFAKRLCHLSLPSQEPNLQQKIIILGSGIIGALVYTFSDTFWFSAVEGEVYALSSLFTAITFWAILKWEEQANEKNSWRWILLIAYLIGLSIGVHLLNLLAIPAIIFVIYYKKYTPKTRGIITALIISIASLALLLWVVIPYMVTLWGYFDRFFTTKLSLPVGFGSIFYFSLLFLLLFAGILFSHKKQKRILNFSLLAFTFILIGYSSFAVLVIRANANTPINEGNPNNGFSLSSYLGREQYGETPLLYGQYYTAPVANYKDGKDAYAKRFDVYENDKLIRPFFDESEALSFIKGTNYHIRETYAVSFEGKGNELEFEKGFSTIFPRMWSNETYHQWGYEAWAGDPQKEITTEGQVTKCPTFKQNMRFFAGYQLGYMYFRYLMWNFSGRFNDIQGRGGLQDGQWITGFRLIDKYLVDSTVDYPESLANKGHNRYFMLPLILGLIGLLFQLYRNSKDNFVVGLLFFFTGVAIVVYLNQTAYQPRERDYAYAASFYAFAIWIGLGITALCTFFQKFSKKSFVSVIVCLAGMGVPVLMAQQNWDDHDRSKRTIALDSAINYLQSCEQNAILFTIGDNDTFPLWYAQEVEGIRTDVRVVNLSLLSIDWYIDQCKRQIYKSAPLPISLSKNAYINSNRDIVLVSDNEEVTDLKTIVASIANEDNFEMFGPAGNKKLFICPTNKFSLTIDTERLKHANWIPENLKKSLKPLIIGSIDDNFLVKSTLVQLDILANNNWERPIYFTSDAPEYCMNLQNYLQNEGFVYRLLPVQTTSKNTEEVYINTQKMYDNLMNKCQFGKLSNTDLYLDEVCKRNVFTFRKQFATLAQQLLVENKKDSAVAVAEKGLEIIWSKNLPLNASSMLMADILTEVGKTEKSLPVYTELLNDCREKLNYYLTRKTDHQTYFRDDIYQSFMTVGEILNIAKNHKFNDLHSKATSTYFYRAPLYLDFCKRQLSFWFEQPNAMEYLSDISLYMESVNSIIQNAHEAGNESIAMQAQDVMKISIQHYNSLIEAYENQQ